MTAAERSGALTRRRALLLGAAGAAAAAAATATGANAPATALAGRRVSARMVGVASGGFYDLAAVRRFASATGVPVESCLPLFSDVADGLSGARLKSVVDAGFTPVVTWNPGRASIGDIAAGRWDATIQQAARWTRNLPLRIRFGHEMNGAWQRSTYDQPARYIAAWRRAHDIFRDAGNLAHWIWSPNIVGRYAQAFEPYFPGDDYVGFVGLDGYATADNGFRPFGHLFGDDFARLRRLSGRPKVVAETGIPISATGRSGWIMAMFSWLSVNRDIVGLTWWDRDQYSISRDRSAAAAFRRGYCSWTV